MRQLEENQEFGVILCNGDSFYPWCFSVDDIPSLLSHLRYDENIKIIEVQKLTADFNYFNLQMRVSVLNRRMADKKKRRACLAE